MRAEVREFVLGEDLLAKGFKDKDYLKFVLGRFIDDNQYQSCAFYPNAEKIFCKDGVLGVKQYRRGSVYSFQNKKMDKKLDSLRSVLVCEGLDYSKIYLNVFFETRECLKKGDFSAIVVDIVDNNEKIVRRFEFLDGLFDFIGIKIQKNNSNDDVISAFEIIKKIDDSFELVLRGLKALNKEFKSELRTLREILKNSGGGVM